jgi:phospholipid/cholesterol/gamma-HCH transport system substrate-binding protein
MNALSTGMRTTIAAICGLLLLAISGLALAGGGDGEPNTLVTTIKDAGQLETGNEVRASGVLVGEVADISLVDGEAHIELTFNEGVLPVHEDATLTVRPVNLLGENYVALDPGSAGAPFLESGVIPRDQVESAVTLQDVLDTFDAPTAASLASVITALGEGVHDNGGEIAKALKLLVPTMHDAELLGGLLAQQNQVLAELVTAADPVARSLADDGGRTLDRLWASTQRMLSSLSVQQQALEQTVIELPSTLTSAQRTLAELGGVATEATPTLHALRPLTGDLHELVAELKRFADAADPALASLEPVLREAEKLLDQAAPLVARLRAAGPNFRRAAASLKPIGRELLDENLRGVMEFVRKWALSTNGRDGISHYFRGVVYVTPQTLEEIADSLVPAGSTTHQPGDEPGSQLDLPSDLGVVGSTDDGLAGSLGLGGLPWNRSRANDTSALGLSQKQEQRLLEQLLGGGQ